jgi:hypothetical protein
MRLLLCRLVTPAHIVALQKITQASTGFVTAVLVTFFLSPEEQGYYYAIGSILSGYVLLDLGLSGLLVQISARMFPGLDFRTGGHVVPDGTARSSFLGMVAWSRRWYVKAGLAALVLIPIGFLYFYFAKPGSTEMNWQWPWVFVVISVALSLPGYPVVAILEGTGRVTEVYLIRLGHYVLGALGAWALLAGGLGLYAPAMAPISVAVVANGWLYLRYRHLLAANGAAASGFSWREQVWPLQRKVALSWLASYVFLYSPTLVVFYFLDPAMAGQLGLSIVVANLLGSLCASWMIAKIPLITQLVAKGLAVEARELFLREFKKAFVLMCLAYGGGVLVVAMAADLPMARRILSVSELSLLFGVFLIFHSAGMFTVYFRARGRDSLAIPTTVLTFISLAAACGVAKNWGMLGILGAFALIYGGGGLLAMRMIWRGGDSQ